MTKFTWIIAIMIVFAVFSFFTAYAQTPINIKTDKTVYTPGDIVEISGSVQNPTTDMLILKAFNSNATIVWKSQIKLENNSFQTKISLSDPMWKESKFYVITARMNDEIATTSFELSSEEKATTPTPLEKPQEKTETPVITEYPRKNTIPNKEWAANKGKLDSILLGIVDDIYHNPIFMSITVIIPSVIIIYILYLRKIPKTTASFKHRPQPAIKFENPIPTEAHLKTGTTVSYVGWHNIPNDLRPEIASVEFWIEIKNIGGDVAKNISRVFLTKDEIFLREDLKGEIESLPKLYPGEFYYQDFKIPIERFAKLEQNNLFVGILVSYDKHKTKSSSGIIFGIGKDGNYVVDEWFT